MSKVGYFKIFFGFSNITDEHFILEEKFSARKFRSHQEKYFFPFSEDCCDNFQPSYDEKTG